MFNILILCDSRGRNLYDHVSSDCNNLRLDCTVEVVVTPGASLRTATLGILKACRKHYDIIFLFARIIEFTIKGPNGRVKPDFSDVPSAVDTIDDKFTWCLSYLNEVCHKVAICHILCLDISTYNCEPHEKYTNAQSLLNYTIIPLNQTVMLINQDREFYLPFLQDTIHALSKGKRLHKYARFYDGLHPRDEPLDLWGKLFAKAI